MAINPYEYNYINGRFYSSNVGSKYTPFGSSVSSYYSWAVEFESVKLSGSGILAEHVDSDTDGWRVGINGDRHPYVYWSRNSTYRGTYTFSNLTISWNTWFYIKFYIYSNSDTPTIRCTLNNSSQNVTVSGRWNNNYDRNLAVGSSTTSIRGVASVKGYAYASNTLQTATFNLDNISTGATSVTVNGNSFSMPAVAHYSDPAPTVTISLASRTANSLTINATASGTCNKWEYSIDNGSTYSQFSTTVATSTSYTITGLSPNTTYNVKVRVTKQSNNLTGVSATGSYTTIGNALLNSVAEVYADASTVIVKPNMTVYGASFTYTLEIKRGNTSILTLSIPAQSTGTKDVSVTLTSAQRTTLLNGMSNVASFSATYILKTLNNGTQVGSTSSATATIRTSSSTSAPGQASFSYADTNANTVAVTGDSTKLVQGQSSLRLTNLTATAKNGASVVSYNITIGGVTVSSTSGGTVNIGTISQSGTLTLTIVTTDSRGYTSTKTQSITCYAYSPPSISAYSVKRNASTSTQIDMSFSGTFSNVGNNTVTANYKYKQTTAGSYNSPTSVTVTTSGANFSYSGSNIATFSDEYVYDFVITLADGIITETYYITVPSYNPLMAFRPNAVGFGMIPQNTKSVEIAQDWSVVANGKYNQMGYLPYSFQTNGGSTTSGYARIATITIRSNWAACCTRFTVTRLTDSYPIRLYVTFHGEGTNDPPAPDIYYEAGKSQYAFSAFAYKTGTSTWDICVRKVTTNDQLTVWTEDAYYGQYIEHTITYAHGVYSSVPSGAVMATQLPIVNTAKQNTFNYMPYSFAFDTDSTTNTPTTGFHRIATITITGNMQREAIQFVVSRKYDLKPVTLSLLFINEGTTDPTSAALYYDSLDGTNTGNGVFTAFAYRTGTSSWDVYVHKSASQDKITVTTYVPYYIQSVADITYAFNKIDSVPSGATTAIALHTSAKITGTVNTGYFSYTNPNITVNSKISVTEYYRSGGTIGYLLIVQPTSGYMNVYVRNPDRSLPANGTVIELNVVIDN